MAKKENAISAFNDMFVRFYEGHICKLQFFKYQAHPVNLKFTSLPKLACVVTYLVRFADNETCFERVVQAGTKKTERLTVNAELVEIQNIYRYARFRQVWNAHLWERHMRKLMNDEFFSLCTIFFCFCYICNTD